MLDILFRLRPIIRFLNQRVEVRLGLSPLLARSGHDASNALVFDSGRIAIVMAGAKFIRLVTRTDWLSHLRRNIPKTPT